MKVSSSSPSSPHCLLEHMAVDKHSHSNLLLQRSSPKPPRNIFPTVQSRIDCFQLPPRFCILGFGKFSALLCFFPSVLTASTSAWARASPGLRPSQGWEKGGCRASFLVGREERRGKAGAATPPSTHPERRPWSDFQTPSLRSPSPRSLFPSPWLQPWEPNSQASLLFL